MEQQTNTQNTARLLRNHGIVPTAQRMAIANILLSKPQHLSADQLYARLSDRTNPHVSKATVYNTLTLFVKAGLAQEVIADPTRVFYCSTARPHPHFYNVDTNELIDADPEACEVLLNEALPEGTELQGVDVIIRVRNNRATH